MLYNVNGIFIDSRELPEEISAWTMWTDDQGFDFCCISLKSNKIIVFEVYYLNIGTIVYRTTNKIIFVQYIKELNSIVSCAKSGILTMIPL